jgi:hypothetical protein
MAVVFMSGCEAQEITADGFAVQSGTMGYSTAQSRTGAASLRCNPASGAAMDLALSGSPQRFLHFGLLILTMPTVARFISGSASSTGLKLNTNGTLEVFNTSNVSQGASSIALVTGRWYWIGLDMGAPSAAALLQIDGSTAVSGTLSQSNPLIGCSGSEASTLDIYFDDIIVDGAGFLARSNVALLVPTADSAVGTGWTLGTGTAISGNSGSTAVKNKPPLGVADLAAGSDTKQIRNATSNANVNYDATMTTYTAAGVGPLDTVLAVQCIISTAAPVTTSSKQGTVGIVSNPTVANVALGSGGTAGAFWSGTAAGTYATGWKASFGTLTTSPSVTLGTAPVMRITQVTASTRIAMVCFMGIYVAYTPAGAIPMLRTSSSNNRGMVNQAINRAGSFFQAFLPRRIWRPILALAKLALSS